MKKLLTTLFLLFGIGVLPAWASMDTELEVLGFSENGAYIAYQISGFGTGSGIGFSMIQIVDVFANDFAMDDFVVEAELVDQSMEELKAAVFAQARTALAGFGILAENSGSLVYELQGKTSWEQLRRTRKTVSLVMDDALGYRRNYELVLEEREVTADYCRNLQDYNLEPRIFTLILRGEDFSQVLQEDRVLYRSRHCPYAYEIYRVYANGERIAVFLNARTVGWEGDDVYKLVVTGALDR
jgi:predicted secreted protein